MMEMDVQHSDADLMREDMRLVSIWHLLSKIILLSFS